MGTMSSDDLELLAETLRKTMTASSGYELDKALAGLGWHEMLADMPGATPDDVAIHVDRDELTIETRHSRVNLENMTARQESDIVDYRRSFTVPHGLDVDKIKAEVSNGVLALHLPKSPAIKPRQIQVRAG